MARAARIRSTENSSGTSIRSSNTRSPFFKAVEYSVKSLASFLRRGSVMAELSVVSWQLSVEKASFAHFVTSCYAVGTFVQSKVFTKSTSRRQRTTGSDNLKDF